MEEVYPGNLSTGIEGHGTHLRILPTFYALSIVGVGFIGVLLEYFLGCRRWNAIIHGIMHLYPSTPHHGSKSSPSLTQVQHITQHSQAPRPGPLTLTADLTPSRLLTRHVPTLGYQQRLWHTQTGGEANAAGPAHTNGSHTQPAVECSVSNLILAPGYGAMESEGRDAASV